MHSVKDVLQAGPQWRAMRESIADFHKPPETPHCDTCGGLGWIAYRIVENGVYQHTQYGECNDPACPVVSQQRAERYGKICTLSQIPEEYQSLSLASWQTLYENARPSLEGKLDALGAALAFVGARHNGFRFTLDEAAAAMHLPAPPFDSAAKNSIVYSGANGVGKTSLAVSIARALLDDGVAVVYVRLMELFDALKERFAPKDDYENAAAAGDDEASVMSTYQQAPVLVIDEFPDDVTKWRKSKAEALVNFRYIHQLPTIMTTNLNAHRLEMLWGATISQRVKAMAHWIVVDGDVLRRLDSEVKSR